MKLCLWPYVGLLAICRSRTRSGLALTLDMNAGVTSAAAAGSTLKSPTKAVAPPVPSLALTGVHKSPAPTRQLEASNSTPDLPPRATKSSVSMEASKNVNVTSATTSLGVPTIVEGVVSSSSPCLETKSGVVKTPPPPSSTATVGDGAAEGTSARAVGPTPLPRTKRGPSKRGGAQMESKATQRMNFSKTSRKGSSHLSELHRPCLQHSFITEATDVQEMEQFSEGRCCLGRAKANRECFVQGLLHLLDDFHSGQLQAFVKDCSFEKMDNVREQQERLARLHFDLGSQQEAYGTLSEEGQLVAKDHLAKLMTQLQELSTAMYPLHCVRVSGVPTSSNRTLDSESVTRSEQLQSSTSSNEDHQEDQKR